MSGLFTSDSYSDRRTRSDWETSPSDSGSGWYEGGTADTGSNADGWYSTPVEADGGGSGWFELPSDGPDMDSLGGGLLSDDDFGVWDQPPKQQKRSQDPLNFGGGELGIDFSGSFAGPADPLGAGNVVDDGTWGSGAATENSFGGGWLDDLDLPAAGGGAGVDWSSSEEDFRGGARGQSRGDRGRGRGRGDRDQMAPRGERRQRSPDRDFRRGGDEGGAPRERAPMDDLSWWDEGPSAGGGKGTTPEDAAPSTRASAGRGEDSWGFGEEGAAPWRSAAGAENEGGPTYTKGTAVEVVSGPFKDFEGVVLETTGDRVRAEIDVFGKPTVVEVSKGDVAAMPDP